MPDTDPVDTPVDTTLPDDLTTPPPTPTPPPAPTPSSSPDVDALVAAAEPIRPLVAPMSDEDITQVAHESMRVHALTQGDSSINIWGFTELSDRIALIDVVAHARAGDIASPTDPVDGLRAAVIAALLRDYT